MIYRKRSVSLPVVLLGLIFATTQVAADSFLDFSYKTVSESNREISEKIEELLLVGGDNGFTDSNLDLVSLKAFYSSRDYASVWCDPRGPNVNAKVLLEALNRADEEGLNPASYRSRAFKWHCNSSNAKEKAWSDLLLTNTFLRYSTELFSGELDPQQVDQSWHLPSPAIDPLELLQTALEDGDLRADLLNLAPPHPGYKKLREALDKYEQFLKAGDWPPLPPGPMIRAGEQHESLPLLRQRLAREGDYTADEIIEQTLYDPDLEQAVKHFQRRYGLKVDGVIGPDTRKALNVSLPTRIEQLKLNMERWRWMPREMEERYLLVNTAAFELQFIERQQAKLKMRVINGRRDRTTPAFKSRLTHVVFNPYWTVPYRIAVKDLLPKQLADPAYFSEQQIEVFQRIDGENVLVDPESIDWTQYSESYFPFLLRQQPGPKNALGRLKFQSPNRFDIYLHDTPSRSLFQKPVRTFSSGCIRLEDPKRLAAMVMDTEEATIVEKIDNNETTQEPVRNRLPIYVVYLTAWMDENGTVHFRDDVYGKDQLLAEQKQLQIWRVSSSRLDDNSTVKSD
jgi:murein L,D-transpeptidase YcbB/YkuD